MFVEPSGEQRERSASNEERLRALRRRDPNKITPAEWAELLALTEELAADLHGAISEQAALESRVAHLEGSRTLHLVKRVGRAGQTVRGKLGAALLRTPVHKLMVRFAGDRASINRDYVRYLATRAVKPPSREHGNREPVVEVVVPVFRPDLHWLEEALRSVTKQSYPNTRLLVATDGPADPAVKALLDRFSPTCVETAKQAGISATLNAAVKAGNGEYLAFLDQDDTLDEHAIGTIAAVLRDSAFDLVYSDEDWRLASGEPAKPNFKPDWSPTLLRACMYMGHLLVVKRTALEAVGWFRSAFDGAQDYDVALRIADGGGRVAHVPEVLYHWRMHGKSTAGASEAKPWAHEAGRRALTDSARRRGEEILGIDDGPQPHTYRIRRPSRETSALSILICSRTDTLLRQCLASLKKTLGQMPVQLIVVAHQVSSSDPVRPETLQEFHCTEVPFTGEFNFSVMNNTGAEHARHPILLFLNDDVQAKVPGWADALATPLHDPTIGIVGPKLIYPSGAIQHAGIVLGMGELTGHAGRGQFSSDLWRWLDLPRDVSAVTGACLAIRRSLFHELQGFDEQFPVNFNDVDLCLRARDAGYAVVYEPAAVLLHHECQTRKARTSADERRRFRRKWGEVLARPDPFFSPALSLENEELAFARVGEIQTNSH